MKCLIVATLALTLAACSGGSGGSSLPRATAPTATPIATASPTLAPIVAISSPAPPLDVYNSPLIESTQSPTDARYRRAPMSTVTQQDSGGQADFLWNAPIVGIYANMSLYWNAYLPSDGDGNEETLYAPTMKLGNGGCIEFSDAYETNGSLSDNHAQVWDWCNNVGVVQGATVTTGGQFNQSYVRTFSHGMPQMTVEIFGDQSHGWRLLFYNYATQRWDVIFTELAKNDGFIFGGDSWLLYETHYAPGPCPSVPTALASEFSETTNGSTWTTVTPTASLSGDCFTGNSPTYSVQAAPGAFTLTSN